MWNTLLALTEKQQAYFDKKIGLAEAGIDALIGFAVVFAGIAVLVGILALVGWIMKRTANKPTANAPSAPVPAITAPQANTAANEIDEETLAVITAAITAYYAQEKPQCEFTVKRIKRI